MSTDDASPAPEEKITRLPIVGAEAAPHFYVDFQHWWAFPHELSDPNSHRVTLTLGRRGVAPKEVTFSSVRGELPPSTEEQISTAIVVTMSPDFLRQMRERIDFVLGVLDQKVHSDEFGDDGGFSRVQ